MKITQADEGSNRRYRVGLTHKGRHATLAYAGTLREAHNALRGWWGPMRKLGEATGWIVDRKAVRVVHEEALPPAPVL